MTGKIKSFAVLIIFSTLIITLWSAVDGQAFSPEYSSITRGEGNNGISGYNIHVDFNLMPYDPTRVSQVLLTVFSPNGNSQPNNVRISFGAGSSWTTCNHHHGSEWNCPFAPGAEPNLKDIESIQVVAH